MNSPAGFNKRWHLSWKDVKGRGHAKYSGFLWYVFLSSVMWYHNSIWNLQRNFYILRCEKYFKLLWSIKLFSQTLWSKDFSTPRACLKTHLVCCWIKKNLECILTFFKFKCILTRISKYTILSIYFTIKLSTSWIL